MLTIVNKYTIVLKYIKHCKMTCLKVQIFSRYLVAYDNIVIVFVYICSHRD